MSASLLDVDCPLSGPQKASDPCAKLACFLSDSLFHTSEKQKGNKWAAPASVLGNIFCFKNSMCQCSHTENCRISVLWEILKIFGFVPIWNETKFRNSESSHETNSEFFTRCNKNTVYNRPDWFYNSGLNTQWHGDNDNSTFLVLCLHWTAIRSQKS